MTSVNGSATVLGGFTTPNDMTRQTDKHKPYHNVSYDQDCEQKSFLTFQAVDWPLGLVCVPCWVSECALKGTCCAARMLTVPCV